MTDDSVERQLRELGHEWPADESFVDGVMSRVDSEPRRPNVPDHSRGRLMRFSYWAAGTIVVCYGLWWAIFQQDTQSVLYAQMKEALKQVQTIHAAVSVQTDDGNLRQVSETWFARGKGFAVIRPDQVRIDNGTYFWEHQKGSDTASRTKSQGTDELLDQALNIREELERDCERFQAGDRRIDGVDHECYRLTFHGAARPADPSVLDFDKRRTLIFIDPKSLPTRVESHEKVEGEWQTRVVRTWEYNVPVDPKVFEPEFGEHVRVIDTDVAFEQLLAVETSVHTEQRAGLIYTIHQAKRFEGGGVMIVSSVRGTDETLKKYPLTRRMLQPGRYITDGPATNNGASGTGPGYFRLSVAKASHNGVNVDWWMLVPRGRKPDWFEDQDGRVQLNLGITPRGEYAKANHVDKQGRIHPIKWNLALDIPKPDQLPSLGEIARHVHSDMKLLSSVFPPRLHLGVKKVDDVPTQQFGSTDDVSPEQFAAATRENWLFWERGDVEFQFTNGRSSLGYAIGARGTKPALHLNYYSVVDDATLSRAAKRSDLVVLSARATNITDAGLAYLTGLNTLKRLDIADTAITDDGLRHLETLSSLQKLNITGTRVTQSGIERIQKALPDAEIVVSDGDTNNKPGTPAQRFDDAPLPLPSTVSGVVVDTAEQPVADAQVTVLVRRFSKETDEESDGPGPWSTVTDAKGRYAISPTGTIRPNHDEVRIKAVANGFADVSGSDYEKRILKGGLPLVRMLPGRRIKGRLVDQNGNAVTKAIVRFQSCNTDLTATWDSGPFPVADDGGFSVSIPSDGKAAAAVYPTGLAPRFIDVTRETDQGDVVLEKGLSLKGRVVDRNGNGVANTVVGVRNNEQRMLYANIVGIGTAVRTDESGHFQLPPLLGTYKLSVGKSVPYASRQMMLVGEPPPPIDPVTVKIDGTNPGALILLQERDP